MKQFFKYLYAALFAFCLFLSAQPVSADNSAAVTPAGWSAEAELGYLKTSGNTKTQSLNAKLGILYDSPDWRNSLQFETVYGSEESEETGEDVTTNQRFLASGKTDYRFDSKNSMYALALYEDDRFSGYEYQATVSAGYNRRIIETEKMEWSAEIGPGYRFAEVEEDGESKEELIVHVASLFIYQVSQTALFQEEISLDAGADNAITRSTTSLRVNINDHLAMKVSFRVKHTSDTPIDTASTDTETALTLVYGF